MNKVTLSFDFETLNALSDIVFNSDLDKGSPDKGSPDSLCFVDPDIMCKIKLLICHGLNLFSYPEFSRGEVDE